MTEASLKKELNSGSVKYSEDELKSLILLLRRLAEIEHTYHLERIKHKANEKGNNLL